MSKSWTSDQVRGDEEESFFFPFVVAFAFTLGLLAALGPVSGFGVAAIKSAKLSSMHSRKKAMSGMIERSQTIEKAMRSEEHTSELPSLMRTSYAGFCLKKK